MTDVIDALVGIDGTSSVHALRARRPDARENAQKSYEALFAPTEPGSVTRAERLAVALFVASLHRDAPVVAFYREALAQTAPAELVDAIDREAGLATATGPYGSYPQGPLSPEDRAGPQYSIGVEGAAVLGRRLGAALEHAHLLVFRPRDASPAALQTLLDSGWTTDEIVTLSQAVAFLTFQIRVIHGLRVLARAGQGETAGHTAVAAE